MRRRLILAASAAAVLAGSTAAFVVPQAASAQAAPVCVLSAHVALGTTNVIGPTTICL